MPYSLVFTATALVVGLLLAGCADGDDTTADTTPSPSPATEQPFNNADVQFAQGMIPHHQQAIQMAQMAEARATSPEVKRLAEDIEAAQGPEIDTMTGWLQAWGEAVPSGMGHGGMSTDGMGGMMSDQQLGQLEGMSGGAFDEMFLTMMIDHHEGAIEMAKTEQAEGKYPDAIALAMKIETDQAAEIELMERLLGS